MNQELFYRLHQHARKGGKVARRRQVKRVEAFVRWCGRAPAQIGRRQVHEFYRAHGFAPTTARDYDSAIRLLWRTLERAGEPPRPPNAAEGGHSLIQATTPGPEETTAPGHPPDGP